MNKSSKIAAFILASVLTVSCGTLAAGAERTEKKDVFVQQTSDTAVSDTTDTPDKVLPTDTDDTPAESFDTPEIQRETADSPFSNVEGITKVFNKGDLDNDGRISTRDVIAAQMLIAGMGNTPADYYIAGDINNDGKVTTLDAINIQRYLAGLLNTLNRDVVENPVWFSIDGKIYGFYDNDTPIVGFKVIDGYNCYFAEDGRLVTGETDLDGTIYKFLDNGILINGWQYSDEGKSFYVNGEPLTEWANIYMERYYFDDYGIAVKGWQEIGERKYHFDQDGTLSSGWTEVDGIEYYFKSDGDFAVGLTRINGHSYYFDETGRFQTGWITIDDNTYYFTDNGKAALGWTDIDNNRYYFDTETSVVHGLKRIDDNLYYFDDNGVSQVGWIVVNNNKYYFTMDGAATGSCTIDDEQYCFEKDGRLIVGWVNDGENKYYKDSHGINMTGWQSINGSTYFFDNFGVMVTGLYEEEGKLYYFSDTGVMTTGWAVVGNSKYYFKNDGVAANGFYTIDGNTYYFENGKMAVNTTVGLYVIDSNGVCTKATTITGPMAKYKADEIIALIGKDAYSLYAYVVNHMYYSFVNVPAVYNNAQTADWASIAAFGMNRGYGACYHFAAYLDVLFKEAGYTSRIVVGTGYYTSLHCWNQIYVNGTWVNYDAVNRIYGASTSYLMNVGFTFNQYVNYSY